MLKKVCRRIIVPRPGSFSVKVDEPKSSLTVSFKEHR